MISKKVKGVCQILLSVFFSVKGGGTPLSAKERFSKKTGNFGPKRQFVDLFGHIMSKHFGDFWLRGVGVPPQFDLAFFAA